MQLAGWSEGKERPRLQESAPDGKKIDLGTLFEAKNPVSWLFNERAEAPAASRPCVELFGGDRLPGQVVNRGAVAP